MTNDDLDPRPLYRRALAWVHGLMRDVRPDQLGDPTPCPEYDVRTLIGHLVGTAERGLATAQDRPTRSIPHVITGPSVKRLVDRYGELAVAVPRAWAADDRVDAMVAAPWGEVSGRDAVWGFVNETVVHGWDIAVATEQDPEAPTDLVEPVLARAHDLIPATPRKPSYGRVVQPRPRAGPTERLANWLGHRWP